MRLRPPTLLAALAALTLATTAVGQPLVGAYTVGPGGNYPNIAGAIAALTTNGVGGAVTFVVTANDTGPWTINSFPGQGPANPVTFDGSSTVILSGAQPVLTLSGCSDVTIRGFVGTFTSTANAFVVAAGTTNCVFSFCNFQAPAATSGSALFNFTGGTNCRIEDSTFGGAYEALNTAAANSFTTVQRCRMLGGGFWITQIGGTDFTLVNNFIWGNSNYGVRAGATATNLKIWHNSTYVVHTAGGSQYCSLRWYAANTLNTDVRNNLWVDVYAPGTNANFNMWCSGTLRPTIMDYNTFYCPNAAGGGTQPIFGGTNLTLAQWQATGFDLNSLLGDPQYLNPAFSPPDLRIQGLSPSAIAGTALPLVTTDFFGNLRDVPVAMGAHEAVPENLLSVVTSGGGIGDLNLGLSSISAAAVEGFLFLSLDTTQPLGAGPFFGIRPDAATWSILGYPSIPGSPFHFPIGIPGVFPAVNLVLPPGSMSGLSGVTLDAVAVLLAGGFGFAGSSNPVRVTF